VACVRVCGLFSCLFFMISSIYEIIQSSPASYAREKKQSGHATLDLDRTEGKIPA
jgi:hypothetical protein